MRIYKGRYGNRQISTCTNFQQRPKTNIKRVLNAHRKVTVALKKRFVFTGDLPKKKKRRQSRDSEFLRDGGVGWGAFACACMCVCRGGEVWVKACMSCGKELHAY